MSSTPSVLAETSTSTSHGGLFLLCSQSEVQCPGPGRAPRPLLVQPQNLTSQDERNDLLQNGRSVSLVDLQTDARTLQDTPPGLSRTGSQASIGHRPPPLNHAHSNPISPPSPAHQNQAPPKEAGPQSAPQMRRPLHVSISQQRSLQPLSFQNPVYHLTNPAHSQATGHAHSLQDSSSENLSTESSSNSHSNSDDCGSQAGVRVRAPSRCSLDQVDATPSLHSDDGPTPRRPTAPDLSPGTATAVAVPRHGTAAGTAHIIKVEQQSRTGGGARTPRSLPHSASVCSSGSANANAHTPVNQLSSCSAENVALPQRSATKLPPPVTPTACFWLLAQWAEFHVSSLHLCRSPPPCPTPWPRPCLLWRGQRPGSSTMESTSRRRSARRRAGRPRRLEPLPPLKLPGTDAWARGTPVLSVQPLFFVCSMSWRSCG